MRLICQIDRIAVFRCSRAFGQSTVLVACYKQMVYIVTYSLSRIDSSYRLR